MSPHYSPQIRAERLIAGGRVVLAASALFAVWLDPTEPAKFASIAYGLLAAYVAYAVLLGLWVLRSAAPARGQQFVTHAFDLVFFSLFTYLTAGPASPFVAYFVFAIVAATLRWQWRGTLWTAVVSLVTFLSLGVYYAEVLRDPAFALTPFVVRAVYLAVFGVLLGYLGAHEQRTRREIAALADWPAVTNEDAQEAAVEELLVTTERVLANPSTALLWIENEEPWLHLAQRREGVFTYHRLAPSTYSPWVEAALADQGFLCPAGHSATASALLIKGEAGFRRGRGNPVHPALREQLGTGPLLSVPVPGETVEARLFVAGRPDMSSDDLVLGDIVARLVGSRLDHLNMAQRLREVAASEERSRLARDLHDGVLQSFTGIGLRVAAARRLAADGQAPAATARLEELQSLLTEEQRDLRFYIEELTSSEAATPDDQLFLVGRLDALARHVERTWRLRVNVRGAEHATLRGVRARHVYNLVREAVVNAARHAQASRIDVELETLPGDTLRITITDDGHGFPFLGAFDAQALAAANQGPRTLRERIGDLGGDLRLESAAEGSRIELFVPAEVGPTEPAALRP